MATQNYNELNNLKSIPYEKYFGEMELTEKEIKERISLAEELDDVFFFLFALMSGYLTSGNNFNVPKIVKTTEDKYKDIVSKIPEYETDKESFDNHIQEAVQNIVDTTIKHIDKEYYLSDDRAQFIAENETNSVLNNRDFVKAKQQGKNKKRWLSMKDKYVRHTHVEADEQIVNISEAFVVGSSLMMFPRDDSLGASANEIVNCRCTVRYFKSN